MAVNFLYKSEKAAEQKKKIMVRVKTAATGVLAVIVVVGFAMLGAGVYIQREATKLANEERVLQAEVIRLARTESRVWQIDDRARIVVEEAKMSQKMAGEMRRVTPLGEVEIVAWGSGGGKGFVDAEAGNPEVLEGYADALRANYPLLKVSSVTWSVNGKWRMGVTLEGGKQ